MGSFQRNYSKDQVEAFAESVGGGSIFFKAGDIDEEGTRIRIVPWVYDGAPFDVKLMSEGWQDVVDPKTKEVGKKPIRFDFGVKIPESGIKWSESTNFNGQKETQYPKSAVSFVFYYGKKQKIFVTTLTQSGLVKPLSDILDPDKETFIEDLTKVDLILTAKQEKGKKGKTYGVTVAATNKGKGPYPDGYEHAIKEFQFSMDDYMACREQTDKAPKGEQLASMFKDAFDIDIFGGNSPEQEPVANKITNTTPAASASQVKTEAESSWKSFTTPKGRKLGDMSLDELKESKAKLEDLKKTDMPIYVNIAKGIEELSAGPSADSPDLDF